MTLHAPTHLDEDGICECDCPECMYYLWDGSVKYAMCRCTECDKDACGLHEEGEE